MTQARTTDQAGSQLSSETADGLNSEFKNQLANQVTWRELFALFVVI